MVYTIHFHTVTAANVIAVLTAVIYSTALLNSLSPILLWP